MEVKVREFQESLSTISMTYDRLDKKAEVINRVSLDVDTSFNQLKEMEQRLSFCSRQMQSLPEEIKDVQSNVDTLMKNSKHLDSAVDKINSLNEMLKDTENLIEKVQNDRGLKFGFAICCQTIVEQHY